MTSDVDQAYFVWSQEQLTQRDGSKGVSVSQMLDHGSVSFGKFEFESLSWEKWSVFTHDRRQEELEKFNGLVAEKKAYFEEYYKKMRALKALQQQQQQEQQQVQNQSQIQNQQTELMLDYSNDGSISGEEMETETETKTEMEIENGGLGESGGKEIVRVESEGNGDGNGEVQMEERVGLLERERLGAKKNIERKAVPKESPASARSRPSLNAKPLLSSQRPKQPNTNTLKTRESSRSITSNANPRPNPRPSSSSSRRPLAGGARPGTPARRPLSAGGVRERDTTRVRERVGKVESKQSNNIKKVGVPAHRTRPVPPAPPMPVAPRKMLMPGTVKNNKIETTKRDVKKVLKENSNSASVKRVDVYTINNTPKSRSINLPPKKKSSEIQCTETSTSNKNKEGNKETVQSRGNINTVRNVIRSSINTTRNATPVRNGNLKMESQRKAPTRTSEAPRLRGNPHISNLSLNGRKAKGEGPSWR